MTKMSENKRRRRSIQNLMDGFNLLRSHLPMYPSSHTLTRLETLRLASCYIRDLTNLLKEAGTAECRSPPPDVELRPSSGLSHRSGGSNPCLLSTVVARDERPTSTSTTLSGDSYKVSRASLLHETESSNQILFFVFLPKVVINRLKIKKKNKKKNNNSCRYFDFFFSLQISNSSASDAFSRHQVALSKSFSPSNVDKAVAFSLLNSAHAQEDEESTGSLTSCLEALLESDSEESFGDGEEGGLTLNEDNVQCLLDVLEQPNESQMDENFSLSFLPEVTTSECISSANAEFNFDFTSWAPTGAGKEDEGMKHNDLSSRSAGLSFYS